MIGAAVGVGVIVLVVAVLGPGAGYVNTIEWLAWRMKVHARGVKARQAGRSAQLGEKWTKELEVDGNG